MRFWHTCKFQYRDERRCALLPRRCYHLKKCTHRIPWEHLMQTRPARSKKLELEWGLNKVGFSQYCGNLHNLLGTWDKYTFIYKLNNVDKKRSEFKITATLCVILVAFNTQHTSYFKLSAHAYSPWPCMKPSAKLPWEIRIATFILITQTKLLNFNIISAF